MINCKQADGISIAGYLESMGIFPVKSNGRESFYLSPYRTEKTPSFCVNLQKNCWYDHADGKGGGLVRLVMLMANTDTKGALALINGFEPSFSFSAPRTTHVPPSNQVPSGNQTESKLVLKKKKALENKALISYAASRGIPAKTAKAHFLEAYYENAASPGGKPFFALAWGNEAGGLELRNRSFKGCLGAKAWTFIPGPDTQANIVCIFEGYIDYVSFLVLAGKPALSQTAVILNSTALAGTAALFLTGFRKARCYMDNDKAGAAAFLRIKEILGDKAVDCSFGYAPRKDINDFLLSSDKPP